MSDCLETPAPGFATLPWYTAILVGEFELSISLLRLVSHTEVREPSQYYIYPQLEEEKMGFVHYINRYGKLLQ